jgi:2-furoyl-CoA dehydrogenase 2Fe-2S iron sulfur subunit
MPRLSRETKHRVTLTLNGEQVTGYAEPRMLLSDFLREECALTGVHVGCEHGVCGACTVTIDGKVGRSCLALAVQAEGAVIETVESLGPKDGGLNDLQKAFRRYHALQCGFCTPGILMSVSEFLDANHDPNEAEVRDLLSGHLCRCTGYTGMVKAVLEVAAARKAAA